MKYKNKSYTILSVILLFAILTAGCSTKGSANSSGSNTVIDTDTTASELVVDKEFSAKDMEVGYDESTATQITLNGKNISVTGKGAAISGERLTISEKGTYVIQGTLTDGQIIIDAEDSDKIQLVLNGVDISCFDSAPIYIKNADKVFLTLVDGTENTLTDGSEYLQEYDNTVDAVIFSKSDITINGNGSLDITANYKHGIVSKDDLTITGGNINISAVKDTLNGKNSVRIKDGTITLTTVKGNGIQSKNDEDETKGYVYICGGTIHIVNSVEGIEGTVIVIDDGEIAITAQDDGLNAAAAKTEETSKEPIEVDAASGATKDSDFAIQKGADGMGGIRGNEFENNTNVYILITGGNITINAQGDGIDSNGSFYVSGGSTYVSGPTDNGNAGLDYNGSAEITGGTIVIAGSAGMAQGFSESSSQYSILYNFSGACEAGTAITLTDNNGNVMISYTPEKEYQSVVISSPMLQKEATYILSCGNQTAEVTLSSVVSGNGKSDMPGPGGMGRPQKEMSDGKLSGNRPGVAADREEIKE